MSTSNIFRNIPRLLASTSSGVSSQINKENSTKALIIPAANSRVSQGIISRALEEGQQVFAMTGSLQKSTEIYKKHMNCPSLQIIEVDHEHYANSQYIASCVKEVMGGQIFNHLGIINTLGGTRSSIGAPDSEETIILRNIGQPKGFIAGALEGADGFAKEVGVVHISSIAVSISDHDRCVYARVRAEGERAITDLVENRAKVVHLRIGLVQPHMQYDQSGKLVLDSGHNHSAEHWKDRSIIMVGGRDDKSVQQPVSLDCVAKGALAGVSHDFGTDNWAVNAVSRQKMTQREYLTRHSSAKKTFPIFKLI